MSDDALMTIATMIAIGTLCMVISLAAVNNTLKDILTALEKSHKK